MLLRRLKKCVSSKLHPSFSIFTKFLSLLILLSIRANYHPSWLFVLSAGDKFLVVEQLHIQMQFLRLLSLYGPGSVVGVATGYGLKGKGIGSRWGARYFEPV